MLRKSQAKRQSNCFQAKKILLSPLFLAPILGQMDPSLLKEAMASKDSPSGKSVMIIDPKARAKDFMQAYDSLRKERSAGSIAFVLSDGKKLSGIADIKLLDGGTLFIFQLNTSKGQKFEVVKIEDIQTISHL